MGRSLLRRRGGRHAWFTLGLALAIPALSACSLVVDPDIDELGPPPASCEAGAIRSCVCSGQTGTQRCTEAGAYTPCDCTRPGGSGAGRGGASAGGLGGGGASGSAGTAGRGQGRGGNAGR